LPTPHFLYPRLQTRIYKKFSAGATSWAKKMSGKQLSGRISRRLLLLRKHDLIKKLPNQRKYMLSDKGRKLVTSIEAALASSVNALLKLAV
jgi:hypothetical protein